SRRGPGRRGAARGRPRAHPHLLPREPRAARLGTGVRRVSRVQAAQGRLDALPRRDGECRMMGLARFSMMLAALAASGAFAQDQKRYPRALCDQIEKADAVVEGAKDAKRVLYVFWDANCYYCNLTWKALQHYEKAGLQVRWVPVAYQKDNSAALAAAVMGAKD